MTGMSDEEARAYLAAKGVSAFIDQAIMKMLEEQPNDPVDWLQAYAARQKSSGKKSLKSARPGAVAVANTGPMWSQIAEKLPAGRTDEERLARAELFNRIDANQSQMVSMDECIQGLKSMLPFDGKEDIGYIMHKAASLIHQLTKKSEVRPPNSKPDDISRPQFRLLLLYLRRYCELLAMIDEFDSDSDRQLDFEEFKKSSMQLSKWGVHVHYPELAFKTMDTEGKGEVPFITFADWVIAKQLECEPVTAEEELQAGMAAEVKANKSMKSAPPGGGAGRPTKSAAVSSFRRGRTSAIDWGLIAEKLPYGQTQVEKDRRKELFSLCDPNGNGYLSLAEVDKALRDIMKLEELFDAKPAIMRAFQAAKDFDKKSKAKLGADFVTKSEFRILLEYLRKYFELFVMFDRLDDDNDRRLNEAEFVKNCKMLTTWGLKVTDFKAEFKKIDTNGGGIVLFDEFCAWAIPQNLDLEDDDN